MVRAFSQNSVKFDHVPGDHELNDLLGNSDHPGRIDIIETPLLLIARPYLIPIRFFTAWVLFTALTITVIVFLAPQFGGRAAGAFAWGTVTALWILIVPSSIAFIAWTNQYFSAKGDYFKVDKQRRTLELCQLDRTFCANEIQSFAELSRWHHLHDWTSTRQISVIVQCVPGEWEVLPLVRETVRELGRPSIAERLRGVFDVPVRSRQLGWRASRALNDSG